MKCQAKAGMTLVEVLFALALMSLLAASVLPLLTQSERVLRVRSEEPKRTSPPFDWRPQLQAVAESEEPDPAAALEFQAPGGDILALSIETFRCEQEPQLLWHVGQVGDERQVLVVELAPETQR